MRLAKRYQDDIKAILIPDFISFDLSPPPPVEDPDRFYRSGEK
jgi:hypothetical protein